MRRARKSIREIDKTRLLNLVKQFPKKKILVIGDIILDEYLDVSICRISPEAPVMVADVINRFSTLGGAANVANNLVALGLDCELIGLIGNDNNGKELRSKLKETKIKYTPIKEGRRPTTIKTRVTSSHQQILRIDKEKKNPINAISINKICKFLRTYIHNYKVIILSDYAKGVLTPSLIEYIKAEANKYSIKIICDPVPMTFKYYENTYLVKPNKIEAENYLGEKFTMKYENADQIGKKLREDLKANLIVTLGKDGIVVFDDLGFLLIPTAATDVYDVSGAGDTTISAIGAALTVGASLREAAYISNICAGIVVKKFGTAVCTYLELINYIKLGNVK